MEPHELERLLREIETASPARQRNLWRRICEAMEKSWFDASWRARVESYSNRYRFALPDSATQPLRVGESWLLLFDRSSNRGLTGRLWFGAVSKSDGPFDATAITAMSDAHIGLMQLVASRCRRLPADVLPERCRVILPESGIVEGRSLGLASAIALLSAALQRPPRTAVAASAIVNPDGSLKPVQYLREKLVDVASRRPEVTRVLVAKAQELPDGIPPQVEVRKCESLEHALTEAGLVLEGLAEASLEEHETRVARLKKQDSVKTYTPTEWLKCAREAAESGSALLADSKSVAAEAFGLAALFALHGAWRDLSQAFQERAKNLGVEPAAPVAAWLAIVEAAGAIDDHARNRTAESSAISLSLAERALKGTQALERRDSEPILGQALGTLGRAYLHAGEPVRGLQYLRESVAHHEHHEPKEAPRSMTYLATCLRHAQQITEARSTIDAALHKIDGMSGRLLAETTRLYALLERGRCALEQGDANGALRDFQSVVDAGNIDAQYPHVAALRGLAAAHRALGNTAAVATFIGRCVKVAETASDRLYRLLGVMPIGDSVVAREPCDAAWRTLWAEVTGAGTDSEAGALLGRWVY